MDKFTNDNKIDSSYTKTGWVKNAKKDSALRCLQELYKQVSSDIVTVDEYLIENEFGKYYFGVKFSIPS